MSAVDLTCGFRLGQSRRLRVYAQQSSELAIIATLKLKPAIGAPVIVGLDNNFDLAPGDHFAQQQQYCRNSYLGSPAFRRLIGCSSRFREAHQRPRG